jgi:GNAT superfamily N-acetyltransferase
VTRARFPSDERYEQAFAVLRPEAVWVAVENEVVLGVLLLRDHGRDPFDLSPAKRLYGRLRVLRHQIVEAVSSGRAVHVASFWSAPHLRGQGIGAAMLLAALPDNAEVTLLARPGRETFYRRHGFCDGGSWRLRLIGRIAGLSPMHRRKGG